MNVVFDTNALYEPTALRRLSETPGLVLWGSMANVIETVSGIRDDRSFNRARSRLQLLLEVSPHHFLPDPDTQFKMALQLGCEEKNVRDWRSVARQIAETPSYETILDQGLNAERLREMRREHGNLFLEAVCDQMIRSINPAGRIEASVFDIRLDARRLGQLRELLFGPEGLPAVAAAWLRREELSPDDLTKEQLETTRRFVYGYHFAFRGWLLDLFTRNRKPRPNDAFDLELAVPLALNDWILATRDGPLLEWLRIGELPKDRYFRIGDDAEKA